MPLTRRSLPLLLPLLSACSPVTVLNDLAPRAGITRQTGIAYGALPRQTLDIYTPIQPTPAPVVMFIYGGGWTDGSRTDYRFVGASLAALGFTCVIPDYRLYPGVRFPAFLQDNAAAFAWTTENITRYGGTPARIALLGHSAGAYNVAMLTLDRQWLGAHGLDPDHAISSTTGLAGPYDFLPLRADLQDIFAPAGDLRLTQPIHFARAGAPSMFLATGSDDTTVYPRNTIHLAEALRTAGSDVETRFYPGIGHELLIGVFAGILRWYAPVRRDVAAFLENQPIPS
jgi:acetyl esterase/lipase